MKPDRQPSAGRIELEAGNRYFLRCEFKGARENASCAGEKCSFQFIGQLSQEGGCPVFVL